MAEESPKTPEQRPPPWPQTGATGFNRPPTFDPPMFDPAPPWWWCKWYDPAPPHLPVVWETRKEVRARLIQLHLQQRQQALEAQMAYLDRLHEILK